MGGHLEAQLTYRQIPCLFVLLRLKLTTMIMALVLANDQKDVNVFSSLASSISVNGICFQFRTGGDVNTLSALRIYIICQSS